MSNSTARRLWHTLEPINAVTYFAPECRDAMASVGLRGFWMGYFASRAAPLGTVGAGVVEATFFNFHPAKVRRAVPDAWSLVPPAEVLDARHGAAAAALRRLVPGVDDVAVDVLPVLRRVIDGADAGGRPLFAANRDVASPSDQVADLWLAATTLREHRGDGHVAALVTAGLDGCEAHVLFAATEHVDASLYTDSRGWSVGDWAAASGRLVQRGLVTDTGEATGDGRRVRAVIERQTDELAWRPFDHLGDGQVEALLTALWPVAASISSTGEITFPNPMGLPEPGPLGLDALEP